MTRDLVVRNATLPDGRATDVAVDGDRLAADAADVDAARELDAEGGLLAPGFVDCHVHLDKAYIADELPENESGTLGEAIANIHDRKREYTVEDVRERAGRAIEAHVRNGCTRLRTHVDVDTIGGLTPLRGVLEAREAWSDVADVQVVAFPQEGVVRDPGTRDLLADALDEGADVVGGMPANERSDADTREHVDACLDLAAEYGAPVDMHVDETDDPAARSLEYLAAEAIDRGIDDVTAGHTCALAAYDDAHAARVLDLLVEAGVKMVTNPPTNLLLQGRHDAHPKRRGITRVDELREAGLTVAAGQDCIRDGFYPYGRASMLETALLTAHAAHLQTPAERRTAWAMVNANAADVMGLDHGLEAGSPATCNVFPPSVRTPTDALREGVPPRYVLHEGRVVAENEVRSAVVA
jgi:cytosine deaminase